LHKPCNLNPQGGTVMTTKLIELEDGLLVEVEAPQDR
jgi:hypothetical protein